MGKDSKDNINFSNSTSKTITYSLALLNAVNDKNIEKVKLLLKDQTIDINQQDEKYWRYSSLHIAVKNNDLPMVELLVNHGAYINCYDSWQTTPLHIAAINKSIPIIHFLIEKGGSWFLQDLLDCSPAEYYIDAIKLPTHN